MSLMLGRSRRSVKRVTEENDADARFSPTASHTRSFAEVVSLVPDPTSSSSKPPTSVTPSSTSHFPWCIYCISLRSALESGLGSHTGFPVVACRNLDIHNKCICSKVILRSQLQHRLLACALWLLDCALPILPGRCRSCRR